MELQQVYQCIRAEFNGDNCRRLAQQYQVFPAKLGFSSYAQGIHWLAQQYESLGLETELSIFPADGKSVYADRHFPLAWDIDQAWAEVDGEKIADYESCSYAAVPFSADSGGVCQAELIAIEQLPQENCLENLVPLITHYPNI
ncbi:MAG: hypothetical protein GX901_09210, partial [Lentisphaerae bacterium]|nr:hypothetical protein [Lentisphaerota bacterium]